MRLLLLALTLLLAVPAAAEDAPTWMRSVRVTAVTPPDGAEADAFLDSALNRTGDLQRCSEQLPDAPADAEELLSTVTVGLWEDGTVSAVSLGEAELPRSARQCIEDVVETMRFPEDPARSDARSLVLTVRTRWTPARLELLTVSDEVRKAILEVPEPTIEGHVDIHYIAAQLDRLRGPLARCVSKRRKKVPDMGDRMDVQIRLSRTTDWKVHVDSIVVVESNLGDEDAEVCVVKLLKKVAWPAPRGRDHARIVWPFVFATD